MSEQTRNHIETMELDLFRYRSTVTLTAILSEDNEFKGTNFSIYKKNNKYSVFHNRFGKIMQHDVALSAISYFIELEGPCLDTKKTKEISAVSDSNLDIPITIGTDEFITI